MKNSWILLVAIAFIAGTILFFWPGKELAPNELVPDLSIQEEEPTPLLSETEPIDTADVFPELEVIDGHFVIDWKFLSKIDFEERYNEQIEDNVFYPIFHPSVLALEGKPVIIRGYVIPFEETGQEDLIILSAFPYSNCFFCGNAGPESVMDIQLRTPLKKTVEQDDIMEFRGKLRLNDTDLYYLNYMLMEAEGVEE